METSKTIRVEVVYARPEAQIVIPVELPAGSTVRDAIQKSGLPMRFPEISEGDAPAGIFGVAVDPEAVLAPHDRVEIYRPLPASPKEIRRRRAAAHAQPRRSASGAVSRVRTSD